MHPTLAALVLLMPLVARADEPADAGSASSTATSTDAPTDDTDTAGDSDDTSAAPAPLPPPPPPADEVPPDLDAEIAAFLGDEPTLDTAAPLPAAPAGHAAPNVFNPKITAFGDLFTTVGVDSGGVMPGSGPWLRSFEMDIRADVDPFAKAVAVVAMEQEPPDLSGVGEEASEGDDAEAASFGVSPEEVYIDLVNLPGGLSARVGQQKLPFGLTNRMHPHDWPWPDAPLAFAGVLGEEGMADVAGVVDWRVPNPWSVALSLTGAVTSGDVFDPARQDATPGWLGRAEYFGDFGQVELGLGVSSSGLSQDRKDGADVMLRWRKDSWHSVVLMAEGFRGVHAPDAQGDTAGPMGWTSTLQLQPTRPLYIGLRVDQLDSDWQYAGYLSYYTTEFLRLRVGATTDLDQVTANAQLTFVWGSHPVEPYWVNR